MTERSTDAARRRRTTRPTRRRLLRAGAGVAAGTPLAGCTDVGGGAGPGDGTATGNGSGGEQVYVPPHVHGRRVAGTATAGGYAIGLAYSVPDYYWTVDGSTTTRVTPENDANLQLLGYVSAPDGGPVLPGVELRATITEGGTTVAEPELRPTLSQRWGLFHAANVALGTYTEYRVELRVAGVDARPTRGFEGAFDGAATAAVTLDFDRGEMDAIRTRYLDAADERGAVRPATGDGLPLNRRPALADLPGTVAARGESGAAKLAVLALGPDESPLGDGRAYLALFAATPYNELWLPAMEVAGTLRRDGETAYDGALEPTLDPVLGYHYGAAVESVERGDALALSVPTPPQVARREGYEAAFLDMPDVELALEP